MVAQSAEFNQLRSGQPIKGIRIMRKYLLSIVMPNGKIGQCWDEADNAQVIRNRCHATHQKLVCITPILEPKFGLDKFDQFVEGMKPAQARLS